MAAAQPPSIAMDGQHASANDQGEESKGPVPVETPHGSKTEREPLNSEGSSASAEPEYPGPVQVALIMTCILCAIFIMSLVSSTLPPYLLVGAAALHRSRFQNKPPCNTQDRTIISTAIPQITDEFNSLDDIGWYGSAFMVTACCFQLLWGKVYGFYPAKYVFLALVLLFEVGSVICAAALNSRAFILGRAIAGMGSAGIMSGAIVLMMSAVTLHKRPPYNGFFSAVLGVSSVAGPLLGGAFTSNVSWRWCFYINLPIGGAAMLVILLALKPAPAMHPGLTLRQQLAKLDLLGELFLFSALVCPFASPAVGRQHVRLGSLAHHPAARAVRPPGWFSRCAPQPLRRSSRGSSATAAWLRPCGSCFVWPQPC